MFVCSVNYSHDVTKILARFPRNVVKRIIGRIEDVAADPYQGHPNVTKLKGRDGYRLRIGDWRVIYDLDDDNQVMIVLAIGPRGQVYKK